MTSARSKPFLRTAAHHAARSRLPRRTRSRGYTVVEVLSAMTLFAIGAAGVITMQRVTIQGGTDARRFDVATNIAHEWTARLQRDSMYWNQPNSAVTTSNHGATQWLKTITAYDATNPAWVNPPLPATAPGGISPAFDVFGRDLAADASPLFCVQYRLQWIAGADPPPPGSLVRAEVRVAWARLDAPEIESCNNFDPTPATNYHFVYATTVLRQNPDR